MAVCIETIVKDIIIPLAMLGTAIYGLKIWKIQLRGGSKYSLTRSVLEKLYSLKEEVKLYRIGFYSPEEIYSAYEKVKKADKVFNIEKAREYAEIIRWNKVVIRYNKYNKSLLKFKILVNDYKVDMINNRTMENYISDISVARKKDIFLKNNEKILELYSPEERSKYMDDKENLFKILSRKWSGEDDLENRIEKYFNSFNERCRKYL